MYLTSNYVLVNEIMKHHKVTASNFSPLSNNDEMISQKVVLKNGTTTVIDKTSLLLPSYIRKLANTTNHTDLTGHIMYNYLVDDYYLTNSQIKRIGTVVHICGKKFIKFTPEYANIFSKPNRVIYPILKTEIVKSDMKEIVKTRQFKQIDPDTFLVWY